MTSFRALPDELVERSFSYLDARALGACAAVSHACERAAISEFELVAKHKFGALRAVALLNAKDAAAPRDYRALYRRQLALTSGVLPPRRPNFSIKDYEFIFEFWSGDPTAAGSFWRTVGNGGKEDAGDTMIVHKNIEDGDYPLGPNGPMGSCTSAPEHVQIYVRHPRDHERLALVYRGAPNFAKPFAAQGLMLYEQCSTFTRDPLTNFPSATSQPTLLWTREPGPSTTFSALKLAFMDTGQQDIARMPIPDILYCLEHHLVYYS